MNIALVHEWLTNMAGSEKVLLEMSKMFPEAHIYASVYNPDKATGFRDKEIRTTYLQNYAIFRRYREALIPFTPMAYEALDLSQYDIVISNNTFASKGVITKPDTLHICYCHTPTRYLWEPALDTRATSGFFSSLRKKTAHDLRRWDVVASSRPDYYLANSNTVKERIRKYYRRDSEVIYPPVDTKRFKSAANKQTGDYYLFVSRLIRYKKADLVIEAFNELGLPLHIIGAGPEESKLKKIAKSNIEFMGRLDDQALLDQYTGAKAFIFPAEEDFGIVPVEAMACGRPVIAYGRGGASESVVDGKTGKYFMEQSPRSLIEAVKTFSPDDYDSKAIRHRADQFSVENFHHALKGKIESIHLEWLEKNS